SRHPARRAAAGAESPPGRARADAPPGGDGAAGRPSRASVARAGSIRHRDPGRSRGRRADEQGAAALISGRRAIAVRDQHACPFRAVLMRLCDGTGARAAPPVDQEGETVDYAGTVEPFEVKIAAAEWQLVLATLERSQVADWRDTRLLVVRSARRSFAAMALS